MEVDFFTAMHPGTDITDPSAGKRICRGVFRRDLALDDVVEFNAALEVRALQQAATALELAGWNVQRHGGGFVAIGSDVKLMAVAPGRSAGLLRADLRLGRPHDPQEITVGSVKPILDDAMGHLIFRDDA